MKSYDKTLTRLILILTKLSNNEFPTIKDLSVEFGVGIRTIQRDIYERLNYFPIEKTCEGQLQFISGFSLNRATLENEEMLLLYIAMNQVKSISKSFESKINSLFAKLLNPDFFSPYYIKRKGFESLDTNKRVVDKIEDSIKRNMISIVKSNNQEIRVKPYKIVNFDGLWYLFARDLNDEKIKTFLIATIDNFSVTDESFLLKTDIDNILNNVYSAWFEDGNTFDVIVNIDSTISHFFKLRKIIPSQEIIKEKKCGTLEVKFSVSHIEDVDNLIKSWLPNIKIVEPLEYKLAFENELKSYLDY